jgi:hypothetical protein
MIALIFQEHRPLQMTRAVFSVFVLSHFLTANRRKRSLALRWEMLWDRKPPLPPRKPTIDDVAALSGVGRATVSRVLNGGPNVRDEVRARVFEAVEKLQYKVNMQARFLAGGRTQVLGLIYASDLDSEPNSFYHSGLELGALRACTDMGFHSTGHAYGQSAFADARHAHRRICRPASL